MTITLRLNDEQLEKMLEAAAELEGISRTEFMRRCVEERLMAAKKSSSLYEAGKKYFGQVGSGRSDLSVRAKEIVKEKIRAHAKKGRV